MNLVQIQNRIRQTIQACTETVVENDIQLVIVTRSVVRKALADLRQNLCFGGSDDLNLLAFQLFFFLL